VRLLGAISAVDRLTGRRASGAATATVFREFAGVVDDVALAN